MATALQEALGATLLASVSGLGAVVPVDRTYYKKGSLTGIAAKMVRTRASRIALDFHSANNVQLFASELFPAQLGIIPLVGDRVDGFGDGKSYAVSMVEDVSAGLGALYRLSLVAPQEVTLG